MADEYKLQHDTARALQAQSLLDSELLQEGFNNLEASYIEAWRNTRAEDQLGREKLFLAVNVIGKVKEHLLTIIANGKLAEAHLYQLAKEAEHRRKR